MKKILLLLCILSIHKPVFSFTTPEYTIVVTFPAEYQVGDYIEFVGAGPVSAGASGYYEISIAYTRGNVAAGATHLASITHANPPLWREVGRVNNNPYVHSEGYSFTIDCNTEYASPRFRIRAVKTLGVTSHPISVYIKVRSINENASWNPLSATGNDLTVTKFLPMTTDWNLYVGNAFSWDGANLAIRAIENGNVGIGTATPTEKLSVNGKIRAKEIKVETINWPDYVFQSSYKLPDLKVTEQFIKENKHLPEIPSAAEVVKEGVNLGEMNAKLLKKIEELTLYIIDLKKENNDVKDRLSSLEKKINQ